MYKILWTVGLSNGETLVEEKGDFTTITGELSPWNRLQAYLEQKKVTITSLSLYSKDGRRYNLPSAGKNPKFKAFGDAPAPVSYRMFRKMGVDVLGSNAGESEIYTVAEATYADGHRLQVWVDDSTGNCWSVCA